MTQNIAPASVDERLLSLMIKRPSGARETFKHKIDSSYIEGAQNKRIFEACRAVFDHQQSPPMLLDTDLVVAELQAMGVYDSLDKEALNRVLNAEVLAKDLPHVVDLIKRRSTTSEIDKAIEALRTATGDERKEILERISELNEKAKTDNHEQKIIPLADLYEEIDRIEEMPDCVPSGFPLLDRAFGGGWSKGGYHVISAPSGTGKTILMLTAWKNMLDQGIPSIYINYEISRSLFMKFMFAQLAGVNPQRPDLHSPSEMEAAKYDVKRIMADLYDRNLLLITDPMAGSSKYWNDIDDMLREFAIEYGAQCVFFDTVNSVSVKTKKGQDARWNEYEQLARDCETLCQELNIAVIFSAQQDTESVKRDDKTPRLGDVAGSKTLTEKAASVTHLLRTDIIGKADGIDYSELHITKNRMMGTELGTVPIRVKYDPRYKRLVEMPRDQQQAERVTIEVKDEVFLTPHDVTGVKKHPTLQINIDEGKEL